MMAARRTRSASVTGGATRLVFTPSPELERFITSAAPAELAKPITRALLSCGYAVLKNAAEDQIIRGGRFRGAPGPRGGRGKLEDAPPHPSRVTSRSGELRRSLSIARGVDRSRLPGLLSVGSDLVYSAVHEYGLRVRGRRYPKRAFLAPALAAESQRFAGIFESELRAHFRLE